MSKLTDGQYGNAIETVKYSTDGEASDWMLGERGILAFSPELGNSLSNSQKFMISKNLIFDNLQENSKIVNLFLNYGDFKINQIDYGFSQKNFIYVSFFNKSFIQLKEPFLKIQFSQKEFV